ncbi:MAG: hypothetical protein QGI49_02175, partial [SAR202 cluster bacterium]|nr:hypothetical protein [SAR202 cluster bacterium]
MRAVLPVALLLAALAAIGCSSDTDGGDSSAEQPEAAAPTVVVQATAMTGPVATSYASAVTTATTVSDTTEAEVDPTVTTAPAPAP